MPRGEVKRASEGPSLVAQRLRLCTPNADTLSLIPGPGTRSHILQLRLGKVKKKNKYFFKYLKTY